MNPNQKQIDLKPEVFAMHKEFGSIIALPLKDGAKIKVMKQGMWIRGTLEYRDWLKSSTIFPHYAGIRHGTNEWDWEVILDRDLVDLDR